MLSISNAVTTILAVVAITSTAAAGAIPLQTVKEAIPPVETDSGRVAGKVLDSGVRAWLGVPYAEPPVRGLRWRPPQRIHWEGLYNADRFQPQCMQTLRGSNINHYFGHEAISENCLYMNIWTPADSSAGDSLPVIVWIYGGGFTIGSASMRNYAGESLAQKGAVYVSISYRVGALGFLAHPELTAESPHRASGNYGLLDQVAALEWIQRNIARFGGDPGNVTIMGQSAGSMSVSALQASPLAANLFHRVVGMSGASVGRFGTTLEEAEQTGLEYQEALGADSLESLRHVAADRVLAHQIECRRGCAGTPAPAPIVDGYFMPDRPSAIFGRGEHLDVPIMVGFTRDEGFSPLGRADTLDVYQRAIRAAYGDKADELLARYPATNDEEAWRAARDIARDSTLGLSMRSWADLQTANGKMPAYAYLFARVQPYTPGVTFADHDPATAGSYHTADVPYWLETLDSLNLFRETRTFTDYDRRLANIMSDAIISFATDGDPSTDALTWPAYSAEDDRMVEFGLSAERLFRVIEWPHAGDLAFFRENEAQPVDIASLIPARSARD